MSNWHEEMAEAVRTRQHAINGIQRWQSKLAEADKTIEELSTRHKVNTGPIADEVVVEDTVTISGDLRPTFGVSVPNTSDIIVQN